jgi:hypothetical protein
VAHDSSGIVLRPTITLSTSPAYATGDVVGGVIALPGVMPFVGGVASLMSVTLKDAAGVGPALLLLFFRATPTGGYYVDNAPVTFGATDAAGCVGVIGIAGADWKTPTGGGCSFVSVANINIDMKAVTSDLSLLILANGAYAAANASNLTAEIGFEQR